MVRIIMRTIVERNMHKSQTRKPTNLTLDAALVVEARNLDINISSAAEEGLKHAVASAKAKAWKQENASAINSSNKWVEKNGLPLEKYRQF